MSLKDGYVDIHKGVAFLFTMCNVAIGDDRVPVASEVLAYQIKRREDG